MRYTIEKIESAPGHKVWSVSDSEGFTVVLEQPNHGFHLDMVEWKFNHEKEKGDGH